MNTSSNSNRNILDSKSDVIALRWFFVIVFVLMSCSGVFGQTAAAASNEVTTENRNNSASVEQTNSQLELVKWFMGSKELNTPSKAPGATKTSAKKQMIESGLTPNRILSRTLLKKAMNYDQATA